MMSPDHGALELLLAGAGGDGPLLAAGLPCAATWSAPKPKAGPRGADSPTWEAPDADPNDLPEQRWGVIAPKGKEGDQLLDAIAPLIRLREQEQDAPARIYRVNPRMDAPLSVRFRDNEYRAEDVPEHERPRYLLILGDLDEVSIELQHVLANGALLGRIHFADASGAVDCAGYAAYAEKVVTWARRTSPGDRPDALFYTARDGSAATAAMHARLVRPCLDLAEAWRVKGRFPAAGVVEIPYEDAPSAEHLMRAATGRRPSVLLSVTHGLGAPRGGWDSVQEQRATQGALALGPGQVLDANAVRNRPFLAGGMWVSLACFGAGTPPASAYYAWLSQLANEGAYGGRVSEVLRSLPAEGDKPFIAALPQAALANPDGPLAVIGHIDLTWTYGLTAAQNQNDSGASRILSAIKALVNGSRAGVALDALMRFYRETNDTLMAGYQAQEDARVRGKADPTDEKERGNLWMLRNDLRGYVLLGDPAVHLAR